MTTGLLLPNEDDAIFVPPPRPSLKTEELLSAHLEQVTFLEAKKRRGKTLSMVCMAYWFRELFGLNIICVGSRMGIRPEFGPYQFLDEKEFIAQLDSISEVSKRSTEKELEKNVEEVLEKMGVRLYRSAMFFDEAYKLFEARAAMDKLVRLFGYFVAQSAHYHVTIVMSSPNRLMLDRRVRQQIDWWGRCFYIPRMKKSIVRFMQGLEHWKMTVDGPRYFPMYDSWTLLGYRQSQLNIGTV